MTVHPATPAPRPASAARPSPASPWTPARLAVLMGLSALAVFAMLDAWADILVFALRQEENSHVLLVPIVAGWLFYVRRDALVRYRPRYGWGGPAVIALALGLALAGYYHAMQALWHLGAVVALLGAVWTCTGLGIVTRAAPAFVVLLFLVPVPGVVRQAFALPLQQATAAATQFLFELAGIEILRLGNLIRYNATDVAVAEACNGMRMVWALLLVSFVVAFASPLRPYVRVSVLLLSPVSALACNILRMVPTVLAYGHWSTQNADLFHDLSGWAMVGLAFLLVLGYVRLLQWIGLPVEQGETWGDDDGPSPETPRAGAMA